MDVQVTFAFGGVGIFGTATSMLAVLSLFRFFSVVSSAQYDDAFFDIIAHMVEGSDDV